MSGNGDSQRLWSARGGEPQTKRSTLTHHRHAQVRSAGSQGVSWGVTLRPPGMSAEDEMSPELLAVMEAIRRQHAR